MRAKLDSIAYKRLREATLLAFSMSLFIFTCALVGMFYLYFPGLLPLSTNFTGFEFSNISSQAATLYLGYFGLLSLVYLSVSLLAQKSLRFSANYASHASPLLYSSLGLEQVCAPRKNSWVISFERFSPLVKLYYWAFTFFLSAFLCIKFFSYQFGFNDRALKFPLYILLPILYGLSVGLYILKARNTLSALLSIVPICTLFPLVSLLEVTRDYIPGLFLLFAISFSVKKPLIRNSSCLFLMISLFIVLIFSFITRISDLSGIDPFWYLYTIDPHFFASALLNSLFYVTGFSFLNILQQVSYPSAVLHSWGDLIWNLQPINPTIFGNYSSIQAPLFDPVRPYSAFSHFYSLSPVLPLLFVALVSYISTRIIVKSNHSLVFVVVISLNLLFLLSFFQYYPRQCIRFLQLLFVFYICSFIRLPSLGVRL